ncbi:hypothetical protein [Lactococcus petauri]|nr:hypothetical protein [Lactococcus petauri]
MVLPGYDPQRYKNNVEKMFDCNLVVYAEDPEFYKYFFKPNTIMDPIGLSCDKVRQYVTKTGNKNVIGIVDGDFNDSVEHNNLFKIDYYSIENLLLYKHEKLNSFKNEIIHYVELERVSKNRLSISFNGDEYCLHKDTRKIAEHFLDYINRKIDSSDKYVKYMDLKELVNAHLKYFKKNYKSTLHTQIKINDIFSESEGDRLKSKIKDVKDVELINGSIDYYGNAI